MIAQDSRSVRIEGTVREASGQVSRRQGIKWIRRHFALLIVIAPRAVKELNALGTLVLITAAAVSMPGVIGAEVFREVEAALGAAVAGANGIMGRFQKEATRMCGDRG